MTGNLVRGVGPRMPLTEDSPFYNDLAVEERPRSPDSGGCPRRPIRGGVLRYPRSTLGGANVLQCRAQPTLSSYTRPDLETLMWPRPVWDSGFSS